MTKPLVNIDPPSCEFLKTNIGAEKTAIGAYTGEAARTNDPIWKAAIHAQAVEEMGHLEMLEGAWDAQECGVESAPPVESEAEQVPEEWEQLQETIDYLKQKAAEIQGNEHSEEEEPENWEVFLASNRDHKYTF